jgi:hypothetical protein
MSTFPIPKLKVNPDYNLFKRAYYAYGYLPLLLVLDQYEKSEYFLTCHLLKLMLEKETIGEGLPTKYGTEALEATKKDFEQRGWADSLGNYLLNVPLYTVECRNFIEFNYINFKN